jgi:hypothetical protein
MISDGWVTPVLACVSTSAMSTFPPSQSLHTTHAPMQLFTNSAAALPAELGPDGQVALPPKRSFLPFSSVKQASIPVRRQSTASDTSQQ